MQEHRIILVGAGLWGKKWLTALANWPNLTLAALVTRTHATLQAVTADFDLAGTVCSTDLGAVLADVDADIVVLVSPAECHLDHIRMSLEAGKHVICEKPITDSADSAQRLAEIVRARPDRKFMVSQTRRFSNQVATLKKAVDDGVIGALDFISFDHRVNFTGGGWRQEMDYPVIQDMISHHLDALRYITGAEAVSVYSDSWNPGWSQFSGKASTSMFVKMSGGIRVNYFGSWTSRGKVNSYDGVLNIMGTDGTLELLDSATLMLFVNSGDEQLPIARPRQLPMVNLEYNEIDGVIDVFLCALHNDTTPPCDIEDNLKTFAFNCAVLESTKTGACVRVPVF